MIGARSWGSASRTAGRRANASLEISHNDGRPASPHAVALSGTGIVPGMTLSAGVLSFGKQRVGTTSGEQTVTLTNSGPAPLVIQRADVEGDNAAEFIVTG